MKAELYRMVRPDHICPFGLKSKDLLKHRDIEIVDHPLKTKEETERFKEEHQVDTTPQTFIDGVRIGGYEELAEYFGKTTLKQEGTTYQPVVVVFSTTVLMALSLSWVVLRGFGLYTLELFIALSMCVLAIFKLRDLYSFSNQFITYDLLARRQIRYAYFYPFGEAIAGIGMLANFWGPLFASIALFIGSVGAISVFKAVYIEKRELRCACVGGDSKVPLGFISLTENLMMVFMGTLMLARAFGLKI